MLQIDHVYEFLYQELFKDFELFHLFNGVLQIKDTIKPSDISIFTPARYPREKIFLYDQEPFISQLADPYMETFRTVWIQTSNIGILVTSEYSNDVNKFVDQNNFKKMYYFFHGFAALDWYRGYYDINYSKPVLTEARYDFISFNRLISDDRSYRIYFVSLLKEYGLLSNGLVSFGVADNSDSDWEDEVANPTSKLSEASKLHIKHNLSGTHKLIIDNSHVQGSASANIPRTINRVDGTGITPYYDSLWHIVTETVFYYDKLHLTEKIFKPIVMKQPFMLLAAPGNLAYLRSYGFKTFGDVIDESYDDIQNNDDRITAVVKQLNWLCNLLPHEKQEIIKKIEPIIEHNFHHFYGEFKHIITRELLDNTKTLFKQLDYNDSSIDYESIYHVLTN